MGADKASLAWDRSTILQRMVAELARRFDDLVVVAGPLRGAPAPAWSGTDARLVRDSEAFQGPVLALRLGLATVHTEVAFVCACDLPFVNADLALALCDIAAGHDAAIPMVDGRMQVLHAAYRKSALPALDAMIERGTRKLQDLVYRLDARMVAADDLRAYDPELRSFLNVNTPEDYARALPLAGKPVP
jgi:molybdopterin-guanine dinucleotide biosynthesis protein A